MQEEGKELSRRQACGSGESACVEGYDGVAILEFRD